MTSIRLRDAAPPDVATVAELLFAASYHDALRADLTPPLEDLATAEALVASLLRVDPRGGIVATVDDDVVGVGWTHLRGRVAALGPIAVVPRWRGRDVGTTVLRALLDRAGRGAAQVRMLDSGLDRAGLAIGLRAGFRVAGPVLVLVLPAGHACDDVPAAEGTVVRAATPEDAWAVVERDARSFGARRHADVDDALGAGRLLVGERAGRIVAHALAEVVGRTLVVGGAAADEAENVVALVAAHIARARVDDGVVRVLVPAGDQRLVDLALRSGFRVERLLSYLVLGGGTAPPKGYVPMPFGRC